MDQRPYLCPVEPTQATAERRCGDGADLLFGEEARARSCSSDLMSSSVDRKARDRREVGVHLRSCVLELQSEPVAPDSCCVDRVDQGNGRRRAADRLTRCMITNSLRASIRELWVYRAGLTVLRQFRDLS